MVHINTYLFNHHQNLNFFLLFLFFLLVSIRSFTFRLLASFSCLPLSYSFVILTIIVRGGCHLQDLFLLFLLFLLFISFPLCSTFLFAFLSFELWIWIMRLLVTFEILSNPTSLLAQVPALVTLLLFLIF